MRLSIVTSSKDLARIRWDLKIEFIKNALILIHLAQLLFKIVCDIESLNRLLSISHVPNMDWKEVSREKVTVACWCKLRLSNWMNYFSKEMLSRSISLKLYFRRVVRILRRHSQITKTDVPIAWRKQKNIRTLGMILHMCDNFRKILNIGWL